LSSEDLVVILL